MLVFSVTPFKIDENKNQNHSIDKVQNLGNERRYICKDPRQDSGQRNISYTRYPKKCFTTGSPSSKYEHRRASALLRNIQNIRICMAEKPTVSVTYENEKNSIKNSLPYLKCVLRLSCVVHGPNYGRFMGFYVNGFLSIVGFHMTSLKFKLKNYRSYGDFIFTMH